MRFMILVKANAESEAGVMPSQDIFTAMADYHEELAKAGVLLDANGLQASSKGFRVNYSGGKRMIVDGPFTETKELLAGFTIIQVKSREEAIEWARRFPIHTTRMATSKCARCSNWRISVISTALTDFANWA